MTSWNQKVVLFEGISEHVSKCNADSLLDIGAGDGELAEKLSALVDTYTAVEKDTKRANELKVRGIDVIEGVFPDVSIDKTYDLVLSSHSMPETIEDIEPFVERAWDAVKPGGCLLLTTFKGGKGYPFKIREILDGETKVLDEELFNELVRVLKEYGEVNIEKRTSYARSRDKNDVLNLTLSSVGEKKALRYREKIKEILESEFKKGETHSLPAEHLFISVKK